MRTARQPGRTSWIAAVDRRRDEQLLDGFHATVRGAADLSVPMS
jgi:hypothetical protein